MATVKPQKINEFTNESEKLAYELLKSLDNSYTVVYEPHIGKTIRRTPDFIIMSEEYGLIVLDVKYVNLDNIKESNSRNIIKKDGTSIKNFKITVKDYAFIVNNYLVKEFKDNSNIVYPKGNKFAGKLTFPHSSGILLYVKDFEKYTKKDIAKILSLHENDFLIINDPKNQKTELIIEFFKNLDRPFKKGIRKDVQGEILRKIYFEENLSSIEFTKELSNFKSKFKKEFIEPLNGNHFTKSKQLKENIINFSHFSSTSLELSNKNLYLGLDNKIEKIKEAKEKVEDEKFTIAVFGYFSSGKSTFLNVLMGIDKLPMDEDRTTAVFTRLKNINTKDDVEDGDIEIIYKDKESISILYKESLDNLDFCSSEDNQKFYEFNNIEKFKDELLSKINDIKLRDFDLSQRDKVKNAKKILRYILSNDIPYNETVKVSEENIKYYLTNDDKAIAISEVIYYLNNELLKNVEIVDTPGFGSSNTLDTLKTQQFLKEVDAVILLTTASAPLSRDDEQKFLENYANVFKKGNIIDTSNLFIVLNKIDVTEKNINEVKKLFLKNLQENWEDEIVVKDEHVFTISSKYHFDLLTKGKSDINNPNVDKEDLENFQKYYSRFLTKEKDKNLISNSFKQIDTVTYEIEIYLKEKIDKLNLDIQEIRKKKEKFKKNREEIEKRFQNYNDAISGIETQLAEYIKKRLDEEKSTYKKEDEKNNAIKKTTKAYEKYLQSIGSTSDKADKNNAKDFYIEFIRDIYNKINKDNFEIFKEKLNEKIILLNKEVERFTKELEIEYGVDGIDKKVTINDLKEIELENIEFEKGFFNTILDILFLGFFVNAKDYAEQMVKKWKEEHYDLIYNKIKESNHLSVVNIVKELNKQTSAIVNQIEQKLEELEKSELKKQENQVEYQEKLSNVKDLFNYIQKYKYKIKNQYESLYEEDLKLKGIK